MSSHLLSSKAHIETRASGKDVQKRQVDLLFADLATRNDALYDVVLTATFDYRELQYLIGQLLGLRPTYTCIRDRLCSQG